MVRLSYGFVSLRVFRVKWTVKGLLGSGHVVRASGDTGGGSHVDGCRGIGGDRQRKSQVAVTA